MVLDFAKEETKEKEDTGEKYETTPVIERAREEREKLEAATKMLKSENDRAEKIAARNALGGITDGAKVEEKKVESPKEYKDRIMRGEANGQKI